MISLYTTVSSLFLKGLPPRAALEHSGKWVFRRRGFLFVSWEHDSDWRTPDKSTWPEQKEQQCSVDWESGLLYMYAGNANLVFSRFNSYLEGKPAAEIRMVSRTPHALSCWTARWGSILQTHRENFNDFKLHDWKCLWCSDDQHEGSFDVVGFDTAHIVWGGGVQRLHEQVQRISELNRRQEFDFLNEGCSFLRPQVLVIGHF